ncbi:ParB/RepB/Spo0J family partition protein [Nocardioides pakistanensis]
MAAAPNERSRTHAQMIPLERLLPSPKNVRSRLNDIEGLAISMREHGVLQSLLVVPAGDDYRIVAGHRRRAAAEKAGLKALPCFVRTNNRASETSMMLVENLQRTDLDPIDAAKGLVELREQHSLPEVARMTGLSQATIRARIGLLDLPPEAQRMLSARQMSLGDAVALSKQVRRSGTGSTRVGPRRQTTCAFGAKHRLADYVRSRCTHADSNRRMLGPGCAECWEATICDDALGQLGDATPVGSLAKSTTRHEHDEAAVQRALDGDLGGITLTVGDREECVRRLVKEGLSDSQIAARIKSTPRTVDRIRRRLSIPAAVPASDPGRRRTPRAA